MILRGMESGRIEQVGDGLSEAWTIDERYLIDESGEVVEGSRTADGLQSFLNETTHRDRSEQKAELRASSVSRRNFGFHAL